MLSEINSDIINTIIQGETIEEMKRIADGSVDMILADLPYGTTACKWDTIIPFEPLWAEYERIIKPNGAIVLTAAEPFASIMRMSNIDNYRHEWIWNKEVGGNFIQAKNHPLRVCENVIVFSKNKVNYYPIMERANPKNIRPISKKSTVSSVSPMASGMVRSAKDYDVNMRYPKNIVTYNSRSKELNPVNRVHPTQKPVALFEYLIRTYTNEGELVLDNVIGSGTTAVAAINTGRQFIGIEREEKYVNIARERVAQAYAERAKTEVMSND